MHGRGKPRAAGSAPHQITGVKHLCPVQRPVQNPPAEHIHRMQQRQARDGRRGRPRGALMIQHVPGAHHGKRPDFVARLRLPTHVPQPVIGVTLHARAAQKCRSGVDGDPHP
jgi:hypothetical protein